MPPSDNDDDFEKWQKQITEAEEADSNRPSTPPEGEEEFIDDDGTQYKWDRGLRAWVPEVGFLLLKAQSPRHNLISVITDS